MPEAILSFDDVHKDYLSHSSEWWSKKPLIKAVQGFDLDVEEGDAWGVVGESGCGKSTLAKMVMGLEKPTKGKIHFQSHELLNHLSENRASFYQSVQMVYQHPTASLNPRQTVRQIFHYQIKRMGIDDDEHHSRIREVLEDVHLSEEILDRYPHEFSGGQAQRVCIARALLSKPKLLVLDEPVSALDVSVQAEILKLLDKMRKELGLTYLFISHDLAVVEQICSKTVVMYAGKIVESGPTKKIFKNHKHPYTKLLLESVPVIGKPMESGKKVSVEPIPEEGCPFYPRCSYATESCLELPSYSNDKINHAHQWRCHHPV
ncbi:MAG: ATP-binding cassette domain-containing protein [SAR324 cluster bacterium]|jgi:peptide/nickel transport system ATP-binding protein|nr:ATP-binding cassette domain-containing protein [SAR324 cluster bacterium]MDP6764979.1 ATP-binding cassette domain-containing protein [SAR324 cluster bacterium]